MTDTNDPTGSASQPSPPPMHRRRGSSVAGQTFQDLYEAARSRQASDSAQSATSPHFPPGSISSAFQAHRRRLSLTTVGLGSAAANPPTSPFAGFGAHRDSNTSTSTTSVDEQAIDDDGGGSTAGSQSFTFNAPQKSQQQTSSTPFGRRMSFGARALRDSKTGAVTGRPMNDSMGWVDSFVNRGDRRASVTFGQSMQGPGGFKPRTQSAVEPQQSQAVPAMPQRAVPDNYGERILRGDVDF